MEPDKNTSSDGENKEPASTPETPAPQAPSDALSRTPDDLEQEKAANDANDEAAKAAKEAEKKISPVKRFFRKINVYFLIFILIVAVVGAIAVVNYLNSTKAPVEPDVASQQLTQEALQQLANTDATVGDASQTLNIQGNAVIAGQTLARGDLNVAGNLQTGGSITAPSITISGNSNLGETQINSLQVATNAAIQGTTTLRDLTVSGAASFSGNVTASQVTVSRLIMSGNAILEVPNHISFTGSSPALATNGGVLGNGGTASINGSDTAGTVLINSGNNPASGCFGRVTFQQAYTNPPHVIVGPVDAGAGLTQYYVTRDRQGFSICTNNAAPSNQTFSFDYFVTN